MMSRRAVASSLLLVLVAITAHKNAQSHVQAFVHFNVIPMMADTVLRDYSIVVANGRITNVAPSNRVRVPPGAALLDGGGSQYIVRARNYKALAAATSNAGLFSGNFAPQAARFGTVTVGARADLLILPQNPLEDSAVLRSPSAVVRLGRVYTVAQLDSLRRAR